MAIDQVDEKTIERPEHHDRTASFIAIFVALALLAVGEIYALNSLGNLRQTIETEQAATRQALTTQINDRLTALEQSNAQVVADLKDQLAQTSQRTGATQKDLHNARALVKKLQAVQAQEAKEVQDELAKKADQDQVGDLNGKVASTRQDLDDTRKTLDATRQDLGMARSQFGTLIARNHDDIEYLRKLGQRNYYEFTLSKNRAEKVAGIALMLKKTNVKHHRFNLNVIADDMSIEKKNRTIDEPIFFAVQGSKTFYELVINQVQSGQVKGYISTPKNTAEVASRSEGAQ
jgi:uncharacterized coiled-coil protein SlyX